MGCWAGDGEKRRWEFAVAVAVAVGSASAGTPGSPYYAMFQGIRRAGSEWAWTLRRDWIGTKLRRANVRRWVTCLCPAALSARTRRPPLSRGLYTLRSYILRPCYSYCSAVQLPSLLALHRLSLIRRLRPRIAFRCCYFFYRPVIHPRTHIPTPTHDSHGRLCSILLAVSPV